jgi:aminoglycoside 3-N-acetyltransferase
MINTLKKYVPKQIKEYVKKRQADERRKYISSLPKLSYNELINIIINDLGVDNGQTVFIHSSMDHLNIDFPSYSLIRGLQEVVGSDGNIIFPTYPKENSYDFLNSGKIFDIKKTPTYTGILNEFARRTKGAVRSLHPTKSVVAIGKDAAFITKDHSSSPFPYDINSPYYKSIEMNAKIIGLGVSTNYLSCVHSVDDIMRENFPVDPYHKKLFEAKCIDYDGEKKLIKTYAHNMSRMEFDNPAFFKKHISDEVCKDIEIEGMKFFTAKAKPMFEEMIKLAKEGVTIYKRIHYK